MMNSFAFRLKRLRRVVAEPLRVTSRRAVLACLAASGLPVGRGAGEILTEFVRRQGVSGIFTRDDQGI
jgi:hypothetical protein